MSETSAPISKKWRAFFDGAVICADACDLDGDGLLELVAAGHDQTLKCFNNDGSELWFVKFGDYIRSVVCADITQNGKYEVVAGSTDRTLRAFTADGTKMWLHTFGTEVWVIHFGDADNDGAPEIIVSTQDNYITAFNSIGEIIWKINSDSLARCLITVDLYGNGSQEFIIGTESGSVKILSNGVTIKERSDFGAPIYCMAVEDINKDGELEIVIGTRDNKLRLLNSNLEDIWEIPLIGNSALSCAVADIDSDGEFEIVIGGIFKLLAYNKDGTELWSHNAQTLVYSVMAADMTGNHAMELIFPGPQNSIGIFEVEQKGTPKAPVEIAGVAVIPAPIEVVEAEGTPKEVPSETVILEKPLSITEVTPIEEVVPVVERKAAIPFPPAETSTIIIPSKEESPIKNLLQDKLGDLDELMEGLSVDQYLELFRSSAVISSLLERSNIIDKESSQVRRLFGELVILEESLISLIKGATYEATFSLKEKFDELENRNEVISVEFSVLDQTRYGNLADFVKARQELIEVIRDVVLKSRK